MTSRITKIDYKGDTLPPVKHIEAYYIENIGWHLRETVVDFIRTWPGYKVYVGNSYTEVEVVDATPPYIRSKGNSTQKDNLLNLPKGSSGLV